MPVYGVYHVFCDKGWRELVTDQISRLKKSGLYDVTARLYVSCIVTDAQDAEELRRMIGEDKVEMISVSADPARFEYPALEFMRDKSSGKTVCSIIFTQRAYRITAAESQTKAFSASAATWMRGAA